MVPIILRNRFLTAVQVKNRHLQAGRNNLCTDTIMRRFAEFSKWYKTRKKHRNSKLGYVKNMRIALCMKKKSVLG